MKSWVTPYSKLRENQWKVIINSLKINENDPKIELKLTQNWAIFEWNSDKIDYKLTQILAKIEPNPDQIYLIFERWDNKMNNGFGLRGHFMTSMVQFSTFMSITKFKMLGGYGR